MNSMNPPSLIEYKVYSVYLKPEVRLEMMEGRILDKELKYMKVRNAMMMNVDLQILRILSFRLENEQLFDIVFVRDIGVYEKVQF
ncbi:MAG: hypothetical protein EZS28_017866 [Streblomastix strix]|uniref:Uncharacterized protein n=1 Tax=Streblomastix strix TaxID=222440 RepID=A0A5J4VVX7_9EUKA|nr:MAG: hypothetical protein EZS28_017866 [Streblomastix strix]